MGPSQARWKAALVGLSLGLGSLGALAPIPIAIAAATLTLTPVSTGFPNPIGIDYYQPKNEVLMSVNYFSGNPNNFVLVAPDGSQSQFSTVKGLSDEVYVVAIRGSSCQGGFTPGDVFVGTGTPGVVAKLTNDGATIINPWATLPGESGLLRGGLFQDVFCVAGGDLVVTTTAGDVWRVTSAGVATEVAAAVGDHLEGPTTVPNDSRYGPWAGTILAASESCGCVRSIDPSTGSSSTWSLGNANMTGPGVAWAEGVHVVPANQNFYGVDFRSGTLLGAGYTQFSGLVGDILVPTELPGRLVDVTWNAATGAFDSRDLLTTNAQQWEGTTFAPAGIPPIPPVVPTVSCDQAGQMLNNASLAFRGWSIGYGISVCEGLVLSHVGLEGRLMAERMSLPYLDLVTCTSSTDISHCTNTTTRHVTLRPESVEPQINPANYTRVHLVHGPDHSIVPTFAQAPCFDRPACDHVMITADWQVDLAPVAAPSGLPPTYLDITQRYEFYSPFKERQFKDIACEPSQSAPIIGALVTPLPDCGRWKPVVTYTFFDQTGTTLLVSLNAAARFHYTPDAAAVRAGALMRDCNANGPPDNCDPTGHLEVYPPGVAESAISHEVAIRGLVADPEGASTLPGRYDNVHQTPSGFVQGPVPIPPGCPECVHMHWRWGDNLGAPAFFGDGQPLIGDAIPAAQPNPSSHQQLDVALVAYHSEALSPYSYIQLVKGANPDSLNMLVNLSNHYQGGIAAGKGTLENPSGSCASAADLTSWGQCGEVVWLSATSYTNGAHDEDHDAFFAFGGFFCGICTGLDYAIQIAGLAPTYRDDKHITNSDSFAVGSQMTILFSGLASGIQVNDVLPPGLTGVTAGFIVVSRASGHPFPGSVPNPCPIATDAAGRQVVTCNLPQLGPSFSWNITITGNVATAPGHYTNTVHAIWGSGTTNDPVGGNYKNSDPITVI